MTWAKIRIAWRPNEHRRPRTGIIHLPPIVVRHHRRHSRIKPRWKCRRAHRRAIYHHQWMFILIIRARPFPLIITISEQQDWIFKPSSSFGYVRVLCILITFFSMRMDQTDIDKIKLSSSLSSSSHHLLWFAFLRTLKYSFFLSRAAGCHVQPDGCSIILLGKENEKEANSTYPCNQFFFFSLDCRRLLIRWSFVAAGDNHYVKHSRASSSWQEQKSSFVLHFISLRRILEWRRCLTHTVRSETCSRFCLLNRNRTIYLHYFQVEDYCPAVQFHLRNWSVISRR